MTSPLLPLEGTASPPREERGRLPMAAFIFVILALIALATIPGLLLNRITRNAEETATTIRPANDAMRDLAFAQEERVVAARSRFLTNDPQYDARLAEAKRSEDAALRTLAELAPRLGISMATHFESLSRHMAVRDSLEQVIATGGQQLDTYREAIPRFDAIRDSMLVELTALRSDLVRAADSRAADEARWARLQRMLSFGLGAVALVAALLVGWSAVRQQRLQRETQSALDDANRQRTIAERRGDELQRATETRARLLRGVTHDVKNPLGAAKGYAELLQMGVKAPMLPEQAPLIAGVVRSVDGALAIIADLLDLARADSAGLAVNRLEVDLAQVAREAAEAHRPAAETAGHTIEVVAPQEPLKVFTDPARVTQVLGNLVSNAIKYTPTPGAITVVTAIRDGSLELGGDAWVTVQVTDNGPGIPADQRDAIFDEFTRLDDAGPQKGHGLGLAIARRIARLLGGDLNVEPAAAGGANFVLWLPLRDQDEVSAR